MKSAILPRRGRPPQQLRQRAGFSERQHVGPHGVEVPLQPAKMPSVCSSASFAVDSVEASWSSTPPRSGRSAGAGSTRRSPAKTMPRPAAPSSRSRRGSSFRTGCPSTPRRLRRPAGRRRSKVVARLGRACETVSVSPLMRVRSSSVAGRPQPAVPAARQLAQAAACRVVLGKPVGNALRIRGQRLDLVDHRLALRERRADPACASPIVPGRCPPPPVRLRGGLRNRWHRLVPTAGMAAAEKLASPSCICVVRSDTVCEARRHRRRRGRRARQSASSLRRPWPAPRRWPTRCLQAFRAPPIACTAPAILATALGRDASSASFDSPIAWSMAPAATSLTVETNVEFIVSSSVLAPVSVIFGATGPPSRSRNTPAPAA